MENWGLITYREYYLFIDEERDTYIRKRSASSIIGENHCKDEKISIHFIK